MLLRKEEAVKIIKAECASYYCFTVNDLLTHVFLYTLIPVHPLFVMDHKR